MPSTVARVGSVAEYFAVVYRRTWKGSIVGRFLSPLLFLMAMGLGLGSLVDNAAGGVDGTSYLHFVAPAIVMNQAMWLAMGESTYNVMGLIKWNQMYRAMLATPLEVADVLLGHLCVVGLHLLTTTAIFVAITGLFGGFVGWSAAWLIPIGVLTGLAFAVPIFAFSSLQDSDSGFNVLFRFVATPLMLFSGTFFPLSSLPGWLQPVAWISPLSHGIALGRGVSVGTLSLGAGCAHVGVLMVFLIGGWLVCLRTFTKRLRA